MRIITRIDGLLDGLPDALRGGTLAMGNFDGVHRGHQAVIGAAIAHARAHGRPSLVATFDPHPSRYFRPDSPPFTLTRPEQKAELFAGLGADATVVIPFDATLAGMSAEAFMAEWLRDRLGVAHVVTGEDFSFGHDRRGNAGLLAHDGFGFTAQTVRPVELDSHPVSSTRVRNALAAGDMAAVARLLTRPFAIRATVIHGDQRGRSIGVPTANMELGDYVRPRYGVYAVRARLQGGAMVDGIANLGVRPMFDPPKELLESWLFDWSGDLYGRDIEVQLIAFIREERKLSGLDALKAQIMRDAEEARRLLAAA